MGNSYSTVFFKEICEYVKKFNTIKKVVVNDCFTQRKDDICNSLELLTDALEGKGVFALDISHNAISKNGCETLSKFFKTNKCLEFLWADNIGLSQSAVPVFVDALVEGAPPLKFLTLSRNKIEVSVVKIAELVKALPTLQDFTIVANTIKGPEMKTLVDAFKNNQTIEKLNISDNFLDQDCFEALLEVMRTCSNLKSLNISDLSFEEEWVPLVIDTLKNNKCKLEEFYFDYCEIYEEEQINLLVYELIKNGKLNYLSLIGTDIEQEYANGVLDKMKEAITDKEVDLQFIWDADAEEEKREEEEEDSDFKKTMYTIEHVNPNQDHYIKSYIFANTKVADWHKSFFNDKLLYNTIETDAEQENYEMYSGGFMMPNGEKKSLTNWAGSQKELPSE